jgi:hypothetical protein
MAMAAPSPVASAAAAAPGNRASERPLAFNAITEMFWIAVRLVHVGHLAASAREGDVEKGLREARSNQDQLLALLRVCWVLVWRARQG